MGAVDAAAVALERINPAGASNGSGFKLNQSNFAVT